MRSPSPRSSRGEGRGEGLSPPGGASRKTCTPHPDRTRSDPTSPRKRGEVRPGPRRSRSDSLALSGCRRPIPCPSRRSKRLRCCPTASGDWFAARGWSPREHQLALLAKARDDRSALLIAPTGAGKTLAGISADAGGAFRFRRFEGRRREEPRLHRPRREAHRRPAHPLHLAAEGARGRHRAQSGDADRRDGAADQGRDPHRRYAGVAAAAAAALSAGHPAHHAGATGAVAVVRRRAVSVLLAQAHRARRTACARHLQARRSAVARPGAAVAAGAGDARDRPVGDGGRAGIAGAVSGAAARRQGSLRRYRRGRRRGGARRRDARHQGAAALGRPHRAPCARRNVRADQAQQDHADLRQHPQPGRNAVPGSLAHERRRPRDRAASRLARRRAAPQGRGRDGGRKTARRGLHLLARSRHRLGRHRSRHQCRRAQGLLAPDAADRPRQPPARRALARRAGSGQPLRGAGMPRRDRCDRRECAGHAAVAHRRARRAGAARARLRLRRAVSLRRALRGGADVGAVRRR